MQKRSKVVLFFSTFFPKKIVSFSYESELIMRTYYFFCDKYETLLSLPEKNAGPPDTEMKNYLGVHTFNYNPLARDSYICN